MESIKQLILLLAKNYPFFVVAIGVYFLPCPKKFEYIIVPSRIKKAALIAIIDKVFLIVGLWAVIMNYSVRWTIITSIIGYTCRPFIMAQIAIGLTHGEVKEYKIKLPAIINALIMMTALFSDIAFTYDTNRVFHRGPLGLLPHFTCLLYFAYYIWLQIRSYLKKEWKSDNFVVIMFTITSLIAAAFESLGIADDVLDNTILVAATFTHIYNYIQYTSRDSLTFLLNRQAYYEYISGNEKKITGIIAVDMNGLKGINDTFGHAAGDRALKQMGDVLKKTKIYGTMVYRMGGDEFTILCTRSDKSEIKEIVDIINSEMAKTPYSCSIGYAYRDKDMSLDELNREADRKMYMDKEVYYETHDRRR